jgi:hypothetical protein
MNIKLLGKTINIGKKEGVITSTSYMVNPYYKHQDYVDVCIKPGQIIHVGRPKFIIPDSGDNSEEYW